MTYERISRRIVDPRHFLATDEWSDAEILALLERARSLKAGESGGSLEGQILGLVFFNPSLRTRASFETAMLRHGGHSLCLEPGKGVWAFETRPGVVMDGEAAEHLVEAARVLGRYVDGLAVRAFPAGNDLEAAFRDPIVRTFAAEAGVPVINLESARRHPCQGLGDALTLQEKLGDCRGRRFSVAWAWHPKALPTAVPVSAAINAARLGMHVVLAHPPGFALHPEDMAAIDRVAGRNGASITCTHDLEQALSGTDVVYAKSWGSLECFGDPEREAAMRAPYRNWRIDETGMRTTREAKGLFMHCLPIRRNVIATDAVLDGPWSVVVDQAENRLHVQRALLLELFGGKA